MSGTKSVFKIQRGTVPALEEHMEQSLSPRLGAITAMFIYHASWRHRGGITGFDRLRRTSRQTGQGKRVKGTKAAWWRAWR